MDDIATYIEEKLPLEKDRMGCSEFVDRCFLEAGENSDYALDIENKNFPAGMNRERPLFRFSRNPRFNTVECDPLEASIFGAVDLLSRKRNVGRSTGIYLSHPSAVSPHDLEISPNLKLMAGWI